MGTGPHLGGGPAFGTGPDPAGQAPVGASSATASAHGGISSPSGGCPMGPRSADRPSGILYAKPANLLYLISAEGRTDRPRLPHRVALIGTTQEGVTGFDFGG